MEKIITYCYQQVKVACDEKCEKAWGINNRPKVNLSDDPDDYYYLADDEVGIAPQDPGTYEGSHAKPVNKEGIPNKWCVRECERCNMFDVDAPVVLTDFSKRVYNGASPPNLNQSSVS